MLYLEAGCKSGKQHQATKAIKSIVMCNLMPMASWYSGKKNTIKSNRLITDCEIKYFLALVLNIYHPKGRQNTACKSLLCSRSHQWTKSPPSIFFQVQKCSEHRKNTSQRYFTSFKWPHVTYLSHESCWFKRVLVIKTRMLYIHSRYPYHSTQLARLCCQHQLLELCHSVFINNINRGEMQAQTHNLNR